MCEASTVGTGVADTVKTLEIEPRFHFSCRGMEISSDETVRRWDHLKTFSGVGNIYNMLFNGRFREQSYRRLETALLVIDMVQAYQDKSVVSQDPATLKSMAPALFRNSKEKLVRSLILFFDPSCFSVRFDTGEVLLVFRWNGSQPDLTAYLVEKCKENWPDIQVIIR